jgi:serine/threonine protein kinase
MFNLADYHNVKALQEGRNSLYSADDPLTKKKVCLKIPNARDNRLCYEAGAVQAFAHPSIIKPYHVLRHEFGCVLVLPYADGGSLIASMADTAYDEATFVPILRSVTSGIRYMHDDMNYMHGDLKGDNILLIGGEAMLSDLEDAVWFTPGETFHGTMGTLEYQSPEMTLGEEFSEKTDIWSIGITTYVALVRDWPFVDHENARQEIGEGLMFDVFDRLERISEEGVDCIQGMLDPNRTPGSPPPSSMITRG